MRWQLPLQSCQRRFKSLPPILPPILPHHHACLSRAHSCIQAVQADLGAARRPRGQLRDGHGRKRLPRGRARRVDRVHPEVRQQGACTPPHRLLAQQDMQFDRSRGPFVARCRGIWCIASPRGNSHNGPSRIALLCLAQVRSLVTEAAVNESADPALLLRRYERQVKELKAELAMRDALRWAHLGDGRCRERGASHRSALLCWRGHCTCARAGGPEWRSQTHASTFIRLPQRPRPRLL